jgi:hypothetical protein
VSSFDIKVDLAAFDAVIDGIKTKLQENVRPAAQAGAEVLYQAVLRNVQGLGSKSGNLEGSIYQAFSDDNSAQAGAGYAEATYHVSWNHRKAPHGHLIEFGHIQKFKAYLGKDGRWYTNKKAPLPAPVQIAARPFVRPAMALFPQAEEALAARLLQGIV